MDESIDYRNVSGQNKSIDNTTSQINLIRRDVESAQDESLSLS